MNPIADWIDPEETHRLASALMGGFGGEPVPPSAAAVIPPAKAPAASSPPPSATDAGTKETCAAVPIPNPFAGSSFVAHHSPATAAATPQARDSSPAASSLARRLKEQYQATGVLVLGPDGSIRGGDTEMHPMAFAARGTGAPVRLRISNTAILHAIPRGSETSTAVALLTAKNLDATALEAIRAELATLALA